MPKAINEFKIDAKETFDDILLSSSDADDYYNFKEYKEDMQDFTFENIFNK